MSRGGSQPGERRGGRKKGTPNKATVDIKKLAAPYSKEAIQTLAAIMRNPKAPHAARKAAADSLLDRAHGKPPQALTGPDGESPLAVTVVHVHQE